MNAVGVAVTVPEHTFVPLRLGQLLQQILIVGTDVHVARLNGVDLQIPLYDRWVISGEELRRMYP